MNPAAEANRFRTFHFLCGSETGPVQRDPGLEQFPEQINQFRPIFTFACHEVEPYARDGYLARCGIGKTLSMVPIPRDQR